MDCFFMKHGVCVYIYTYTTCAALATVAVLAASVRAGRTASEPRLPPPVTASVAWTAPVSPVSCIDLEPPSTIRDELETHSEAVISSFFSTTIELVSVDDKKTGLSGLPALVNGNGISLLKHNTLLWTALSIIYLYLLAYCWSNIYSAAEIDGDANSSSSSEKIITMRP